MIRMDKIDLAFDGRVLFSNFSLAVEKGEKVLLSAPSGSGKSSLVKMMLGFVRPDRGRIVIDGRELSRKTLSACRGKICYVSQDVDLRDEVVASLVTEIFSYKNNRDALYTPAVLAREMERFDLDSQVLEKRVGRLSGGERQRLGMIICLLLNRPIWLLDEVTSALDETLKQRVIQAVLSSDRTAVIISHDDLWNASGALRRIAW
ncbi:MAG: ATP-binding cassette domain-containing protein [Desulfobacteraceae bacterium]|nr:ATP-binding cassette domain-containing protein [Desulfobacteraceae bacterium]